MAEFDYGSSGATQAGGGLYVNPTKEGKWAIKKDVIGTTLNGRLTGVDIRLNKGNDKENIPARWEFLLMLRLRDDIRGVHDEAAGVKLADYIITFNSDSRVLVQPVINTLLETDLDWNGWLRLHLYTNDAGKTRIQILTDPSQGQGVHPKSRFKFNMGLKGYEGTPQPIPTGILDKAGNEILDNRDGENFWLIMAKEVYRKINGKDCPPVVFARPAKYAYVKNGIGDATLEGDLIEQYLGRKRHEGDVPTPPPAASVSEASKVIDNYILAVDKAISGIINIDSANVAYSNAKKHLPAGVALKDATDKISAKLIELKIGYFFGADGYTALPSAPEAPPMPTAHPGGIDDLPF